MTSSSDHETYTRDDLNVLVSLADPLRHRLYRFVAVADHPVGRDEAASSLGISRQVAAYHLDKLAGDGLLDIEFRRLTGREGPGAGRPAKLYQRSEQVYDMSVPPRRYDLAAQILLESIREGHVDSTSMADSARSAGRKIGAGDLHASLVEVGYEPIEVNQETRFRNCPFSILRDQDRELTCAMNLALVEGIVDGSSSDLSAILSPEEGYCCVRLQSPAEA